MIVDTSAIIAILFQEPQARTYAEAISNADSCRLSAATFVEASTVVEVQTRSKGSPQFDAFLRRTGMTIEAFTEEHARIARQAYVDFGKGRHPAALNFGDCCAYALSKASGEPLLFQGEDFKKTDIESAL